MDYTVDFMDCLMDILWTASWTVCGLEVGHHGHPMGLSYRLPEGLIMDKVMDISWTMLWTILWTGYGLLDGHTMDYVID